MVLRSPLLRLATNLSRPLNVNPSRTSIPLLVQQRYQQRRTQFTQNPKPGQEAPKKTEPAQPADAEDWESILDKPSPLIRHKQRHRPLGLSILALIPILAFGLGTWQVKRLQWKTELIDLYEDRLTRPPLPLPPAVDPNAVPDFEYRRVEATGTFRHDQEMLIGPRTYEGENGYQVITPLERPNGSKILVNRGWIAKDMKDQKKRGINALPRGLVTVEGLLRKPWKKNSFTPDNRPETGEFYFPDVDQMAKLTGSEPIWIEETLVQDYLVELNKKLNGEPIGRTAAVNLKNDHLQYIVTWYALSACTAVMFAMLVKKPPRDIARRVRKSQEWS
ncbi:SURF1-domain-containing protein [Ascobolus immersus RN42]|uniref:SURF1-like protein n=1 Tax=Ascobolus immersus RN42 TaxID=1160509 RepID=A0A3N4HG01_ASCIM|nr:SURF1-domain-containing protein [Ascobolus immersus RN42]